MNLKFSTFITMYVHFSYSDSGKLESQVIYERASTENEVRKPAIWSGSSNATMDIMAKKVL